jgi:hypothetical protein
MNKRPKDTPRVNPAISDVGLFSAEEYQRPRRLERRAVHVSELSDAEFSALERLGIPAEAALYDHEMI